jgi:uncharacterized membrane protein
LPRVKNNSNKELTLLNCFIDGGIVGFVVWGVYNSSNLVVFKDYPIIVSMLDTLWGTFLMTVSACCLKVLHKF